MKDQRHVEQIYEHRFDEKQTAAKEAVWAVLVPWMERELKLSGPVLDLGCDTGYFIRNCSLEERWASDLREVAADLGDGIRFVQANGLQLDKSKLPTGHFRTIFMSNYLEHLPSRSDVVLQFEQARKLLAPGGRVVVLQPNIRLVGARYWDYIDHHVALTEESIKEAATIAGLATERTITRFLPYTFKSRLPASPALVRWYLRLPLAWHLMGKQTLYVARRTA